MELTALCLRLVMLKFTLLNSYTPRSDAAFLRITPDQLQHFRYESVSFHCEGAGSPRLRVIRNSQEYDPECDMKTMPTGSLCTIDKIYPADGGEYWCETGEERSSRVNITVAAGPVILESPALPVMEGESVTLSCKTKMASANNASRFYKDGRLIRNSSTGEFNIWAVSRSDEGLYKCNVHGVGESAESWLTVRVSPDAGGNFSFCQINHVSTCTSVKEALQKLCRNNNAGSVMLQSPVLPVKEGNNVTLSCRKKATSSNLPADFYKDGVLFSSSATGNTTIHSVSKSDEGLYKCHISDGGESAESWLAVRALHRETCPCSHRFMFVLLLFRTVFTVVMVALLLLLLGLLHCGKLTVTQK